MKKILLSLMILILLLGICSNILAQNNQPSEYTEKLNKFFSVRPCIAGIMGKEGVRLETDPKGYIVVKVTKTGIPEYDNEGGLGFFDYGVVYKVNQPKATGTYNCGESEYKNTVLENIKINWQTNADGEALQSAGGMFEGNNCDNKPLPHEIGCFSAEIGEVQACTTGLRVTGVLDEKTVSKLEELGYNMSMGLTQKIYDEIMIKCGRQPSQRSSGMNQEQRKDEEIKKLSPKKSKNVSIVPDGNKLIIK